MNDDRLRALHAELLQARAGAGREACVTPEAIEALVERTGDEPDRLATLDHVMSCPHCSREFELLRSVDRAGPQSIRGARGRRPLAIAASIAVLITATVFWQTSGDDTPAFRGDAESITLVAPLGAVDAAASLQLVWNRVPDAVRYDVEVLDTAGSPIWSLLTADTTAFVEEDAGLAVGQIYRWWVRATLADSRSVRSAMAEFSRR